MTEPLVRVETLSKSYAQTKAVDGVSFEIAAGEFFALLGPSGCGKTTLMRLIAGFEAPDAGRILLDGRDIGAEPPHRRPINMMFQSYALFPHMSVEANIGFALRRQGMASGALAARVREMLRLVQMEGFETRRPHQLSGGQKARVALARALAARPRLLLLDEPLSALDRKLREETRFELMQVQRDLDLAFLVVTHDQDEAMAMAQRIAVMRDGRIEQIGPAREIYERPVSRWVASFIGDANLIAARVVSAEAGEGGRWRVTLDVAGGRHAAEEVAPYGPPLSPGADVALAVRPERLSVSRHEPHDGNVLRGEVRDVVYLGGATSLRIRLPDGASVRALRPNVGGDDGLARGESVFLSYAPSAARVLVL